MQHSLLQHHVQKETLFKRYTVCTGKILNKRVERHIDRYAKNGLTVRKNIVHVTNRGRIQSFREVIQTD